MNIAVTGGRDYHPTAAERELFLETLHDLITGNNISMHRTVMILGDCPTGVDFWALATCKDVRWLYEVKKADWQQYGKSAGPRRNAEMIKEADFLIAFPGGRGTRNTVAQAKRKGIPVYYHEQYGIKLVSVVSEECTENSLAEN